MRSVRINQQGNHADSSRKPRFLVNDYTPSLCHCRDVQRLCRGLHGARREVHMARHHVSKVEGDTEGESQAPRIPAGGQSRLDDLARLDSKAGIDQAHREAYRP